MAMTYILQKLEELSQKLAVLQCNHNDLYSDFLQYQNDIEDIPRLKERIEQAMRKVQNQVEIKVTDEEQAKEYMSLFNTLKSYFSKEKAEKIAYMLVNSANKGFSILIDGKGIYPNNEKLCNQLQSIGYKAEELTEYVNSRRKDRKNNSIEIVITLNGIID